jgi:hypothetical protein
MRILKPDSLYILISLKETSLENLEILKYEIEFEFLKNFGILNLESLQILTVCKDSKIILKVPHSRKAKSNKMLESLILSEKYQVLDYSHDILSL